MRLALFGGTFNPVHYGHLLIAESLREQYKLDKVVFVPAGQPPHKKAPRTPMAHRRAMLSLAIRGNPFFALDDWEIRQKRVVYTYETLRYFRTKYPRASLYFIVGSDSLKELHSWREANRLRAMCRFISMERIRPYASRDIRQKVRGQKSVRYLVPETVSGYIRRHGLYRKPE